MLEQILLRFCMKMQARFIKQENSAVSIASSRVRRKRNIEREKPAEATATFIEINLDVINGIRVGNQRIEIWSIQVISHLKCAVLPETPNFLSNHCASTVK